MSHNYVTGYQNDISSFTSQRPSTNKKLHITCITYSPIHFQSKLNPFKLIYKWVDVGWIQSTHDEIWVGWVISGWIWMSLWVGLIIAISRLFFPWNPGLERWGSVIFPSNFPRWLSYTDIDSNNQWKFPLGSEAVGRWSRRWTGKWSSFVWVFSE